MDLLVPVASKFFCIIEMIVASFKIGFPLRTLLEVVYGPIAAIEGNRHCRLSKFGRTSPSESWTVTISANVVMVMSALVPVARAVRFGEGWS